MSSRKPDNTLICESSYNFLHHAARIGDLRILDMLILHGCELEGRDIQGITPLESALISQQNEVVTYIVKALENSNLS